MDDDDGQCILPVCLPVTMCQNLDTRLDFNETRLGSRESRPAREEEAGQGLTVSTPEATPRHKSRYFRLHSLHA